MDKEDQRQFVEDLLRKVIEKIECLFDIDENILAKQKTVWIKTPVIPQGYRDSFSKIVSEETECNAKWSSDDVLRVDFMYDDPLEDSPKITSNIYDVLGS